MRLSANIAGSCLTLLDQVELIENRFTKYMYLYVLKIDYNFLLKTWIEKQLIILSRVLKTYRNYGRNISVCYKKRLC